MRTDVRLGDPSDPRVMQARIEALHAASRAMPDSPTRAALVLARAAEYEKWLLRYGDK